MNCLAFCPGRANDWELFPQDPTLLRFDGHGGRFDPFDWPQEYQSERPWWVFLRRAEAVPLSEQRSLGFRPAHRAWSKDRTDGNRLDKGFCTSLLQWFRTLEEQVKGIITRKLRRRTTSNTDPPYPLKRSSGSSLPLREVEAWIEYVQRKLDTPPSTSIPDDYDYPLAHDKFLGAWINDAKTDVVKWLLKVGVPVFVAHTYGVLERRQSKDHRGEEGFSMLSGYTAGTDVEARFSAEADRFMHIANKNESAITPIQIKLSSSLFVEARAQAHAEGKPLPSMPHAKNRAKTFEPKPLDEVLIQEEHVKWIRPPPVAGPWTKKWEKFEMREEDEETTMVRRGKKYQPDGEEYCVWYDRDLGRELYLFDHRWLPGVVITTGDFGEPAPRMRYLCGLDENRLRPLPPSHWMYLSQCPAPGEVGRVQETPPAIFLPLVTEVEITQPFRPGSLSDDEDALSQRRLVQSSTAAAGARTMLLRQAQAVIVKHPRVAGAGARSVEIPAPNRDEEEIPPSALESSPLPSSTTEGKLDAVAPMEEGKGEAPGDEAPQAKGKGKAAAQDDDEVSMGSGSAPVSPRSVPLEDIVMIGPTRTLRLRHVKDGLGAMDFVAYLRNPLRVSARAELASVVNAQHALWVTFSTIDESVRAKAFLSRVVTLGVGVEATYEAEASLHEAQMYSTELWHLGLDHDISTTSTTDPSPTPHAGSTTGPRRKSSNIGRLTPR
ncbi:hypothetical protein C8J57DRAFT_1511295 [Mycena rebaudengoi]|nr:hypothetical protein C8J57DRAFT_1511295 [Mycena rebaudengoi]